MNAYILLVSIFTTHGMTFHEYPYKNNTECRQALEAKKEILDILNEAINLGYSVTCEPIKK